MQMKNVPLKGLRYPVSTFHTLLSNFWLIEIGHLVEDSSIWRMNTIHLLNKKMKTIHLWIMFSVKTDYFNLMLRPALLIVRKLLLKINLFTFSSHTAYLKRESIVINTFVHNTSIMNKKKFSFWWMSMFCMS